VFYKACEVFNSSMAHKTSRSGIELIKSFEGLRLRAYPDPVTGGAPWTIGYGATAAVWPGMTVTAAEAEAMFRHDLARVERDVNRLVRVPVDQTMFDALVSFAYNVGTGNFRRSTLLRKLNAGDFRGAAEQFLRWNRAGGRTVAGLTRRRRSERRLFLGGRKT
jgi:lysozyme